MERLKKILKTVFYPGAMIVMLSVLASSLLLTVTFLVVGEENPIAYLSYVVSAYSLTIVCLSLIPAVRKGRQWIGKNAYANRYLADLSFRLHLSLHLSLGINLFYAGVNGFSGIYYHSVWFGTLAAYYLFLSVMRYLLVRYARKNGFGKNRAAEWKRYRLCGAILMMMNLALAGVVILVIRQNRGFQYAGSLIYAMALYTFYTTIMAVVNAVRYRKDDSPVMAAARVINLVTALVSMLSLETAMLTQFDTGDTSPAFRRIMTGSTGGVVCAFVVGMGMYMMIRGTKELRKLKKND